MRKERTYTYFMHMIALKITTIGPKSTTLDARKHESRVSRHLLNIGLSFLLSRLDGWRAIWPFMHQSVVYILTS